MANPTNLGTIVDQSTVILTTWGQGVNDFVWGAYGVLGSTYTAAAYRTSLGISTFMGTLLDDADAATARATLGVAIRQQMFTATGTFTVPAGITTVYITGCAAGGGGSAYFSTAAGGSGGGGGGGCLEAAVTVTPLAAIAITILAAGVGGAAATNAGTAGGTTSFGSLLSLTGGSGGLSAASGGAGGTATGAGGSAIVGQQGDQYNPFGLELGGDGGASIFGAAGMGAKNTGITPGTSGSGFGAGGGGGCRTAGTNGSAGFLLVRW